MTGDEPRYPVRVDAALDEPVSRGLWLVKWLLLIPHLVVLAFLWIAFAVVSVIAFSAVLISGQYPRALFDFNLGVLRWTWRVQYYGYAALGTDRYPPFTLADVPGYPARLDVPYPGRLSRGLVLVKWWLLALPHYVVVAVFAGGGLWLSTWSTGNRDGGGWGSGGLIGLLVLVAGVVLLFRGRYPRPIYDFVLGMDRWVLRVAAYAALMTDDYPPFRLDMGGTDPGSRPLPPAPGPVDGGQRAVSAPTGRTVSTAGSTDTGAVASAPHSRWTGGRVVAVVVGSLLALTSTGLLVAGGTLMWADQTQRDSGGWLGTPQVEVSTARHALVSDDIELRGAGVDWVFDELLGRARLQVTAADTDDVFVGVAPSGTVAGYLSGVGRTMIGGLGSGHGGWGWNGSGMGSGMGSGYRMGSGMMTDLPGGAPATAPGDLDIWTASVEGSGTQTLEWTPTNGDWTVVVMPADRSAGLTAQLSVAATVPGLTWIAGVLLGGGAVLLAGGVLLIALAVHRAQSSPMPPDGGHPVVPGGPGPDVDGPWTEPAGQAGLSRSGGSR